jgi:hypothetical protein
LRPVSHSIPRILHSLPLSLCLLLFFPPTCAWLCFASLCHPIKQITTIDTRKLLFQGIVLPYHPRRLWHALISHLPTYPPIPGHLSLSHSHSLFSSLQLGQRLGKITSITTTSGIDFRPLSTSYRTMLVAGTITR